MVAYGVVAAMVGFGFSFGFGFGFSFVVPRRLLQICRLQDVVVVAVRRPSIQWVDLDFVTRKHLMFTLDSIDVGR